MQTLREWLQAHIDWLDKPVLVYESQADKTGHSPSYYYLSGMQDAYADVLAHLEAQGKEVTG